MTGSADAARAVEAPSSTKKPPLLAERPTPLRLPTLPDRAVLSTRKTCDSQGAKSPDRQNLPPGVNKTLTTRQKLLQAASELKISLYSQRPVFWHGMCIA